MGQTLTILFGAIIGVGLGILAKSLINKIDSKCHASIGLLALVGCFAGLVFAALITYRFSAITLQICYAVLCAGLIVQSMIDAYTHQLVRQITHAMAISGLIILSFYSARNSTGELILNASICACVGILFAVAVNKISHGSLGAGDVRLMAVLGWHLGFLSYSTAVWALFASSLLAGVFGVALIVFGRGSWQRRIAFGPFLMLGTVIAIFGDEVLPRLLIA